MIDIIGEKSVPQRIQIATLGLRDRSGKMEARSRLSFTIEPALPGRPTMHLNTELLDDTAQAIVDYIQDQPTPTDIPGVLQSLCRLF